MNEESDASRGSDSNESVDELFIHLEGAKERYQSPTQTSPGNNSDTPLQNKIRQRSDAAVLASNHEPRLEEIENNDQVTHRSGKRWASAEIGVDAHGRLPIYYRLDGLVTHRGYISSIVLDPSENTDKADEFLQHITDADTYSEYYDELGTTTFIVTDGQRLADPFPQSELEKLSGNGSISENYSRQPAYVVQRSGDFPDFE